ncbi:MAG TPA: desulfoferrodoxin [bacterium]|jgi:superoxide reductase|nr:desulfoferrodoxin [Myxococcales bacterium]HQG13592.1 desulfoferrodoxin [bacterium]
MTKKLEIYKCEICGNMVEMIHAGAGSLVCCNQPMRLFAENTTDGAKEKHVPVVETQDGRILVKVGSAVHPMEEKHYIEWIELIAGDKAFRKFLKPGDKPEAAFCKPDGAFTVREYCNLHGLWKGES